MKDDGENLPKSSELLLYSSLWLYVYGILLYFDCYKWKCVQEADGRIQV